MDESGTDRVTIEVSKALVEKAEQVGLDVGEVFERALRQEVRGALGRLNHADREARREQLREEIRAEVERFDGHVEKHGLLSDEWRKFC